MQYDICLRCASLATLIAALKPLGLTTEDESGQTVLLIASNDHALVYAGRVAQTPAEIDQDGNVTTEATYWPGEYAVLRADENVLDRIAGAALVDVEAVTPPAGCTTFGEWRVRPTRPEGPTLAEAQATKIAEAADACQAALKPYSARFPALEQLTWPAQLAESTALLANPSLADVPTDTTGWLDPIPTIRTITAVTGESLGEFAAAVQANNESWLRIAAAAAGQRQKAVAEIKALTDPAQVSAYKVEIVLG